MGPKVIRQISQNGGDAIPQKAWQAQGCHYRPHAQDGIDMRRTVPDKCDRNRKGAGQMGNPHTIHRMMRGRTGYQSAKNVYVLPWDILCCHTHGGNSNVRLIPDRSIIIPEVKPYIYICLKRSLSCRIKS